MLQDAYRLQGSIKKKTTDAITEPGASRFKEANMSYKLQGLQYIVVLPESPEHSARS